MYYIKRVYLFKISLIKYSRSVYWVILLFNCFYQRIVFWVDETWIYIKMRMIKKKWSCKKLILFFNYITICKEDTTQYPDTSSFQQKHQNPTSIIPFFLVDSSFLEIKFCPFWFPREISNYLVLFVLLSDGNGFSPERQQRRRAA